MTADEFVTWLDGYLQGKESLNRAETEVLRKKVADAMPVLNLYGVVTTENPRFVSHDGVSLETTMRARR